jgi:hypothetical protein
MRAAPPLPHSWEISMFLSPSLKPTVPSSPSLALAVARLRLNPRPPASGSTRRLSASASTPPAAVRHRPHQQVAAARFRLLLTGAASLPRPHPVDRRLAGLH